MSCGICPGFGVGCPGMGEGVTCNVGCGWFPMSPGVRADPTKVPCPPEHSTFLQQSVATLTKLQLRGRLT